MSNATVECQLDPQDAELFAEAQQLLSVPPTPSLSPTDSFWAHFQSSLDENALRCTQIRNTEPYAIIIIGAFHALLFSPSFLLV